MAQNGFGAHPDSYSMDDGGYLQGENGGCFKPTTHLQLVSESGKYGYILVHPLLYKPSWLSL
jgi:hypothetical protein